MTSGNRSELIDIDKVTFMGQAGLMGQGGFPGEREVKREAMGQEQPRSGSILKDEGIPVEEAGRTDILDMEPTKAETFWNVGLLVISYVCMGGFLAAHLIVDLIRYIF